MTRSRAIQFIVLLGLVSLFADTTYEGARSILGPFLATLGASGFVVATVSGAGELAGHALRLASGYLADRTRRYWAFTLCGYAINLLAVPLLAWARSWPSAAFLVVLERTGKAFRTPARDAMLAQAGKLTGEGWGFGLHEAMDQIGAVAGPLVVTGLLASGLGYSEAFLGLGIPAVIALGLLVVARWLFPQPVELQVGRLPVQLRGQPRTFWWFLAGAGLLGAGFADFPLLAYHLQQVQGLPGASIAALYALAMGADAAAALVLGRWFDRRGLVVLLVPVMLLLVATPLVFLASRPLALLGVVFWGCAMGAVESILRAAVAKLSPADRRASAYGLFHSLYGLCWFGGSMVLGASYDFSPTWLVTAGIVFQLASAACLLRAARSAGRPRSDA